jgi:ornithine cyclodeaminase/alanine dehydrogenase-like protein (mu-crystallin family)
VAEEARLIAATVPAPVLLLDRETVAAFLSMEDCIAAVEAAFAAHACGRSISPQLLHVNADGGEFHIKAGGLREQRPYFACKINGGFFGNRASFGLPTIIGLILLCDGTNGAPLAVMESGLVTRLRTGAATAVAAKYLARPDSEVVTICGAGIQADIQLRGLTRVLPLRRAFVWSRGDPESFAARIAEDLDLDVRPATDLGEATRQSDVIVTCTPAKSWILGRQHVPPGAFIAAIGTDSPDKQEIEPELLAASSVVCDLVEQCAQVGDLHHAITAGLMTSGQIRGELGSVITGRAPKRHREDEIIIFDSTGTAIQDAAVAAVVYEKALATGYTKAFAFWS